MQPVPPERVAGKTVKPSKVDRCRINLPCITNALWGKIMSLSGLLARGDPTKILYRTNVFHC